MRSEKIISEENGKIDLIDELTRDEEKFTDGNSGNFDEHSGLMFEFTGQSLLINISSQQNIGYKLRIRQVST